MLKSDKANRQRIMGQNAAAYTLGYSDFKLLAPVM
jgi:hypothetical protein